jgi:hypothetical protein
MGAGWVQYAGGGTCRAGAKHPKTKHRRGNHSGGSHHFRLLDSLRRHCRIEVHANGTIEETPVMSF